MHMESDHRKMYSSGFTHLPNPFYSYQYWPTVVELSPNQSQSETHTDLSRGTQGLIVATNCRQCLKDQERKQPKCTSNMESGAVNAQGGKSMELKFGIQRILSGKTTEKESDPKVHGNTQVIKPTPYIQPSAPCCTATCCVLYAGPIPFSPPNQPVIRHARDNNAEFNLHDSTASQPKRKRSWSRAVFSNLQRKGLEKRFEIQKYVTKPDRRQLAAMLGLTDAQVKVWFQNRRMKWRHSKESEKHYHSKQAMENERATNTE